jgi:hypothetical protein
MLTNESHTFAASTNAAIASSTTCSVVAYKGTTQVAASIGTITGQVNGLTTSISNNGTTSSYFTVSVTTALTTKNGVLTIPIVVDGKSFEKKFSWSLSLQGVKGDTPTITTTKNGKTTTIKADGVSIGTVIDGVNGESPTVSKTGKVVTITDAAGTKVTVSDGEDGVSIKGDDGDDAYFHIA